MPNDSQLVPNTPMFRRLRSELARVWSDGHVTFRGRILRWHSIVEWTTSYLSFEQAPREIDTALSQHFDMEKTS